MYHADEPEQDVEDANDDERKDDEKDAHEEEEEEVKDADAATSDNKETVGAIKAENDGETKELEPDFSVTASKDSGFLFIVVKALPVICYSVPLSLMK
jgi:hypothetical protein